MGTNLTGNGAERKLAELAEEVLRLQRMSAEPAQAPAPAPAPEPALAPLVDRIAHGFAKSLVVALKELENHIAAETRKVGDAVGRRLDALQASVQDLSGVVSEQRAMNLAVQEQCRELQEADARLSERIDGLCKDVSVQQEDIAAFKSALSDLSMRADGLIERLDRQAETLRSMCGTYAQRETELEQLVEGLARLRAFPAAPPTHGL